MTPFTTTDEYGVTTLSAPVRTARKSLANLQAEGFRDMNRSGCSGEFRRDTLNTETHSITEIYTRGSIQVLEWRAV